MIGVMRGSTWKQEGSQSQSVQYRASSWNWWSVVDSLRVSKHFGSGSTLDASQVNTLLLPVKRKARKDASKRSCGTSKYLSGDCTQQVIDWKYRITFILKFTFPTMNSQINQHCRAEGMTDTSFLIANAQIVGFPIVYVSDHFSRLVGHRCLFQIICPCIG